MSSTQQWDVIVIGAGFSGVVAASRLAERQRVLVLEARDRVGGRTDTQSVTVGHDQHFTVDLGCSAIHGYNEGNPMREIAQRLGVPVRIVKGAQTAIYTREGNIISPSDALALIAEAQSATSVEATGESVSLYDRVSSVSKRSHVLDIARLSEIGAGISLEAVAMKYWGWERNYAGTDGIPIGGYIAIMSKLWDEAKSKGVTLQLQEQVVAVERDFGGGIKIIATSSSGEYLEYTASACLSTIPLGVLKVSPPRFDPPLPPVLQSAITRTSVGLLNKIVLGYSDVWWPNPDAIARYVILPVRSPTAEGARGLLERTTLSIDNLAYSTPFRPAMLLLAFGANQARELETYSDGEIKVAMHEILFEHFSSSNTPVSNWPISVTVTRWGSDSFARGATSSPVAKPWSEDDEAPSPLDFITLSRSVWNDRLYFAGEHTDFDHHGSVVGAVLSGEREATKIDRFLERLRRS